MFRTYSYKEILEKELSVIFVDVRSESEYAKEHIPNAVNIPLLNDEERKDVGTIYKHIGKRQAKEKGLEYVAPKLYDMYQKFYALIEDNKQIVVYCARGGMRSQSITSLLQQFSFSIAKLDSGYKGYREYISTNFTNLLEQFTFVTLYGPTGSGKTRLLNQLAIDGYDILDLEGCANNRGSLLGGVGLGKDNSQKYFESLVFDSLLHAKSKFIFTEGESKRIGSVVMLDFLYQKIRGDYKVYIDCPLDRRVLIIKQVYISEDMDLDEIRVLFDKLEKYHGKDKINLYLEQLSNNQSEEVIESLIVNYYDKVYSSKGKDFKYHYINNDEKQCANEIIKDLEKMKVIE